MIKASLFGPLTKGAQTENMQDFKLTCRKDQFINNFRSNNLSSKFKKFTPLGCQISGF